MLRRDDRRQQARVDCGFTHGQSEPPVREGPRHLTKREFAFAATTNQRQVRVRLRMSLSSSRARWLAAALSASLVSLTGAASGQMPADVAVDASEQTDGDPAIVLIFEPGQPDSDRLVHAIESHLVGLPVRVVLEPLTRREILKWFESGHLRAKARRAIGLFAIETGHHDLWRLYFLDMDGAPTLIRRLRPSPEHAPLDDAGVAVRLLVEALLDAKPLELDEPVLGASPAGSSARSLPSREQRSSAREQPDARSPQVVSPRPVRSPTPAESHTTAAPEADQRPSRMPGPLGLFVGPVGTTWVAGQAWQFGARGGAELHLKAAWSVALDYTWYPTASVKLESTSIAWDRHPVATQVAYRPRAGISPRFWLGVWGDAVTRRTLDTAAAYQGTATVTTWSWGPAGGVGLATPSSWSFSALLDVGVDVATERVEYVVQSDTRQPATTTRTFRPLVSLRLGWRP
jgi:hypothetical protein